MKKSKSKENLLDIEKKYKSKDNIIFRHMVNKNYFKPLPNPIVDQFLLELNFYGLISDNDIKEIVEEKLLDIDD